MEIRRSIFGDIFIESLPSEECLFCKDLPEIDRYPKDVDWQMRVVRLDRHLIPTKFKVSDKGFYEVFTNHGYEEAIIESKVHESIANFPVEKFKVVIDFLAQRKIDLEKKGMKDVVAIKRLPETHPVTLIYGFPFLTPEREKIERVCEIERSKGKCIFCEMTKSQELSNRTLLKDENHISFLPGASFYDEIWIVPRKHKKIEELSDDERFALADMLRRLLLRIKSINPICVVYFLSLEHLLIKIVELKTHPFAAIGIGYHELPEVVARKWR